MSAHSSSSSSPSCSPHISFVVGQTSVQLSNQITRYHYSVDQNFVENVLWKDDSYEMETFIEYYHDTEDFKYMQEGTFFILRRDSQNQLRKLIKQYCHFKTGALHYVEIDTVDMPPNMYCCLSVDRYKKPTEPDTWYDVAILADQDKQYYAVRTLSFQPQEGTERTTETASKILAFIYSKFPGIYNLIKEKLSSDEKKLASSSKFYIPQLTDEDINLNAELYC